MNRTSSLELVARRNKRPVNGKEGMMEISEGKPYPLGAAADDKGANFAVFSANATRVEVSFSIATARRSSRALSFPSARTKCSTAI